MSLEIATREQDGISILELSGQVVYGPEDTLLSDEIRQAAAASSSRLVIDFDGVNRMDSAGLGTLLSAQAQLKKSGGRLALSGLHSAQLKMLRVGRIETVLELHSTTEDALESFCAAPEVTKHYPSLVANPSAQLRHHV